MKFAICHELFEGWDWERQCEFIAKTGYQGIEVAPFTLAPRIGDVPPEMLEAMREQAEAVGLKIIGLHWLLAKTEGLYLTSPDEAVRQATSDYLIQLGEACAALGGTVMVHGSPFQRNLLPGVSREQAYEYAADVFSRCLPTLAKLNVNICMEPLTTKETDFVLTCADAMELIEKVDQPNFVLHQDVKAMLGSEADSIPVLIHRYRGKIGHFHVNDSNLLGPGMGETDFHPIIRALVETGYDGWVSVEPFDYSPGCERIARESLEYMQRVLSDVRSSLC